MQTFTILCLDVNSSAPINRFRRKLDDAKTFTDANNYIQIFLFCGSVATYSDWDLGYCEKMLMFELEDNLLVRLWKDLEIKLHEQANLYLKSAKDFKQEASKYKQPSCR